MPTYSADQLADWRRAVGQAWRDQLADPPEGWSVSPAEFGPVLAVFSSLTLKPSYAWRAYQYRARDSGNGRVYAVPEEVDLPEPTTMRGGEVSPPPQALDHLLDSVDGDGSPESYVQASLLWREMESFGTAGHGRTTWDESIIVEDYPLDDDAGSTGWVWLEEPPDDWRPHVDAGEDGVIVRFYSATSVGQQQVRRHTDFYLPRGFRRLTQEDEVIARGPRGFLH